MPPWTVENPEIEWPPPRTASVTLAPGQIDGANHVGHTGTLGDDRWMAIVRSVPDAARAVILLIARLDHGAAQACGEFGEGGLPDGARWSTSPNPQFDYQRASTGSGAAYRSS